jgi:hypothetical protein
MLPALSDEQVRTTAVEILQRAPYTGWRNSEAVLAALEPILRWLSHLNDWLLDLALQQPVLYWLLMGGLLLVAGLLLAHVLWSVRIALSMPAPAATPRVAAGGPSLVAEAEALAAQGRYLDAAHRLQLATIELLLTRRLIALSRFEPNRVLRSRLHGAALPDPERRALLALVDRLEARWFRDRANDAALYGDWYALHRRVSGVAEAA